MKRTAVRAGDLLVATNELLDPNFAESVVLMLHLDDDGALGVVLNRPSPIAVADVLPGWESAVAAPDVLFSGGPVEQETALAVAVVAAGASEITGFQPLAQHFGQGILGLVDLDAGPVEVSNHLQGFRIFAGYSGWGADQLQAEIAEGSWFVVPAIFDDLYAGDVTSTRSRVLRRQPGELAWQATRPDRPEMN